MKITKWIRKKAMRRLTIVEGNRITARERRIKRTIRWAIIATCAWVIPFTTEYTEHIVIENVYAGEFGEKSVGTLADGSLITNRVQVADGLSEETVETKIRRVFSENPDEAVAIAKCESHLDDDRIGDLHLPVEVGGETLGYSYGLFQIRSGGKDAGGAWSRPAKEGMTLSEWAKKMLDPDENIKEAKKIYDKSGWGPWTCSKILD